jgi:hypothetical protein
MDSDERDIFNYLKTWGEQFVSVREICRRAGTKARFAENADWAKPLLQLMMERGLLERDVVGRYRIKPKPKKHKKNRWVSPHIAGLLKEKGLELENGAEPGGAEADEPSLEDFEQH